jgi:hypothetical protein
MFCTSCGKQIADNTVACPNCGAAQTGAVSPNIPNHLVGAILATIFCCQPFGIVAIVYAARVNGKIAAGDFAGAKEASDKAKTWMNVAIGVGAVVTTLSIILQVIGAMAE